MQYTNRIRDHEGKIRQMIRVFLTALSIGQSIPRKLSEHTSNARGGIARMSGGSICSLSVLEYYHFLRMHRMPKSHYAVQRQECGNCGVKMPGRSRQEMKAELYELQKAAMTLTNNDESIVPAPRDYNAVSSASDRYSSLESMSMFCLS
jgi:hypothetical protein